MSSHYKQALLPCKRCGKQPYPTAIMGLGFSVECGPCGLNMPFPPAASARDAADYWNRENHRAADSATQERK